MSIVTVISHKLVSLILGILGLFKRALCFITRRRKNSGTLLPTSNHYTMSPNVTQSVPGNEEVDLDSWDNWGSSEAPVNISIVDNGMAPRAPSNSNQGGGGYHSNRGMEEPEEQPDIDFFEDMTPHFKRPKRVLIRKKEEQTGGLSSRLTMATEIPQQVNPELGSWEETENAWEEDLAEDLSWEAEAAIKDKRRQEREKRAIEHQKKKLERDVQRLQKKDSSSHIGAVKLS